MSSFDRKLKHLYKVHVADSGPDPSTLSERDRAIAYARKWDLAVQTAMGLQRAHTLSDEDWTRIRHLSPEEAREYGGNLVMPGVPKIRLPPEAWNEPGRSEVAAERAPPAPPEIPEPETPKAPPPPPPPYDPGPPGYVHWVPRHEANAMRERDWQEYVQRQNEERRCWWKK